MPGEVSRSYTGPMDESQRPKAITCDAIRRICEADGKSYAVLISVDRAAGNTLFTTWGRTPEDKAEAKATADHLSAELCPSPGGPDVVYESFVLDAATNKAKVERLEAERAMMLDALRSAKRWMNNAVEVGYVPRPQPGTLEHKTLADVDWTVACIETFDESLSAS